MKRLRCEFCGAEFACNPEGDCWCKHVPAVLPVPDAGASCICPCQLKKAGLEESRESFFQFGKSTGEEVVGRLDEEQAFRFGEGLKQIG